MPSSDHELPLEMLREEPRLAVTLARAVGLPVPDGPCRVGSEVFTNLPPTELRKDRTIVIGDPPEWAVVVEIQRRFGSKERKEKSFAWPLYVASTRKHLECPASLLVWCSDEKTAAKCAEPIPTGHPDWSLRPRTTTGRLLPPVLTVDEATSNPAYTVLVNKDHVGRVDGDQGRQLVEALYAAMAASEDDLRDVYYDYVTTHLSPLAKAALEEFMGPKTYEYQSEFARRYFAEGEVKGQAKGEVRGEARGVVRGELRGEALGLLAVLRGRGLEVSEDVRDMIMACAESAVLLGWLERAASVASPEELVMGTG